MTVRERVLAYLQEHPEGVDDDELTQALGLKHRQHANQECLRLEAQGLIERRRKHGKIHNFPKGLVENTTEPTAIHRQETTENKPWFWEGNVQDAVADYLKRQGYTIARLADTRSREPGKDIEAKKQDDLLWVTVKGYPEGTKKTHHSTQAGHYFKDAFFDMALWRGENEEAILAMALPDFPRYRDLAKKVKWIQSEAGFAFIWVKESGEVEVEGYLGLKSVSSHFHEEKSISFLDKARKRAEATLSRGINVIRKRGG